MWRLAREVGIAQLRAEVARVAPILRDSRLGGDEVYALKDSKCDRDTWQA